MSTPKSAGIILIGDELLSGKIVDVNGQLLIRRLRSCGVRLTEMVVVADVHERIVEAFERVCGRNDVVFSSGGIGPTHDDKTMEAVADAFSVRLHEDPALISVIKRFSPDSLDPWRKMATVPEGCEFIFHDNTRWPTFKMQNLYILPGIPMIFERQINALTPDVLGHAASFALTVVYFTGSEGEIAALLGDLEESHEGLAVGSYPVLDNPSYKVRITLESLDRDVVTRAQTELLASLEPAKVFKVEENASVLT